MPEIDIALPSQVPADLAELIQAAPLPGLGAGPKCPATFGRVQALLRKHPRLAGTVTEAAIWLLAGELDRSHEVSQSIESPEAAYWHGIMHRREGDFWNAKYWFRKVGKHPVFSELAGEIGQLKSGVGSASEQERMVGQPSSNFCSHIHPDLSDAAKLSSALVDDCERALASHSPQTTPLQRICWLEWQFLFRYGWD